MSKDDLWDDLVAAWKLDEASGTRYSDYGSYNLSEVGGRIADAAGKDSNAVSLVAADLRYLYGSSPVPLTGSFGITVAAWLYIPTGAPTSAIWFWNGGVSTSNVSLGTPNASPTYCFFGVRNELGETQSAGADLGAYDTWFFVVGKFDPATRKCSLSVDGGAWSETSNAALTSDPSIVAGFRSIGYPGAAYPTARIDERGVWNRAITDLELAELYASGSGKFFNGSPSEAPTHAYSTAGDKTAEVKVTDSNGCVATDTVDITIVAGPTAEFTSAPVEGGLVGEGIIQFTDATSGGTAPYTYAWDMGDGSGTSRIRIRSIRSRRVAAPIRRRSLSR